ncbi:hypothetical protein WwSim0384 [Wolbachia endosymbiont of Drosophila simulans]|nr:hypothetical protein WwSim0384 [Wolbachia endosymbiont of Drosophila simulans]
MQSSTERGGGSCTSLSTGSTLFTCGESTHELGDSSVFCSGCIGDVALDSIPLSELLLLSSLLDGGFVCFVCSSFSCSISFCVSLLSPVVQSESLIESECSLSLSENRMTAALSLSLFVHSESLSSDFFLSACSLSILAANSSGLSFLSVPPLLSNFAFNSFVKFCCCSLFLT